MSQSTNRRDLLKAGVAVGAAALLPTAVHAAGNDQIKVGLIGCGGRGTGAMRDSLEADKSVVVHAVGDFFLDRASGFAGQVAKQHGERVAIGDRVFGGLDAAKQVVDSGADLIILATPPGFRPQHLELAVKAGKNIFCEKPVAVDGPGIRKCLELAEEAKKKGLAIVAGTQRRHQAGYIETVKRIQDGAIGEIISTRCAWNNQGIWFHPRKENDTDLSYQINNWYHFLWLCGDHIVEQHVHNLDVINWVLDAHPLKASAIGGRSYRQAGDPNKVGHIWDHFAVEYTYPNDVPLASYCAHIPNIDSDVSETVYGTKGKSQVNAYRVGKQKVHDGKETNAYVQEHIDLIQCIKAGKPINELKQVAESTMTAILGRMAAYSGKTVTWEQGLNSKFVLMPEGLTAASHIEVPPVPVPGKYKV